MYKVLKMFDDLLDPVKSTKAGTVYHRYEAGDDYPRKGYNPPASRVLELGTTQNRLGAPLIEITKEQADALLGPVEEKPKKKVARKKKAKAEPKE